MPARDAAYIRSHGYDPRGPGADEREAREAREMERQRYEIILGHAGYGVRDNRSGEFIADALDSPDDAFEVVERAEAEDEAQAREERRRAREELWSKSDHGVLRERQWELLAAAEEPLYRGDMGCHAWTDVMPREESKLPAQMWEHAYSAADMHFDEHEGQPERIAEMAAEAVAYALATLAFGAAFATESYREQHPDPVA